MLPQQKIGDHNLQNPTGYEEEGHVLLKALFAGYNVF